MKALSFLVITITLLFSLSANATEFLNKTITDIYSYDNRAYIQFTPAQVSTQGCQKNNQVHIDMTNEKGQTMYVAASTAAALGKKIDVKGNSGCDPSFNAETIYRVRVKY